MHVNNIFLSNESFILKNIYYSSLKYEKFIYTYIINRKAFICLQNMLRKDSVEEAK